MAETKRDNNQVEVMMGVLNTDGVTPIRVKADPSSHLLAVDDNTTGSDFGKDLAARDNSGVPVLIATDGSNNIINLYVDSSGNLLIDST